MDPDEKIDAPIANIRKVFVGDPEVVRLVVTALSWVCGTC